jgi:hypothetical protein
MGFEIVPAVVPDLLPHRRRAVVKGVVTEAAECQYVFLDTQSPAGTGDIVGFGESVNGFAVNAAVMVAFPNALFDGLGNGARFSAFA